VVVRRWSHVQAETFAYVNRCTGPRRPPWPGTGAVQVCLRLIATFQLDTPSCDGAMKVDPYVGQGRGLPLPLYDLTVMHPAVGWRKGLRHKGSACCGAPAITTKS
jgi:hypothetical protein